MIKEMSTKLNCCILIEKMWMEAIIEEWFFEKTVGFERVISQIKHTDPELQAIVQGLEVSSPSFRAIFGVFFCDYDVSQGLRG